ncbi:MAG TPA: hypothetical protein VGJ81_02750 [Thermoanaerobaculia bacterium]|jgi:hypothetical protein
MADQTTTPAVPVPNSAFADPPATPTAAEAAAKDFLNGFRELTKKLPKFDSPHPITAASVRGRLNTPPAFAKAVAGAVAVSPDLQAITGYDLEAAQTDVQQLEAVKPVIAEVRTFLKAMVFWANTKQVKLNNSGLTMYNMARVLARDPNYAHIGALADTMADAKRRKKRQTASQAGQQPQNGGPIVQTTTTTTPTH